MADIEVPSPDKIKEKKKKKVGSTKEKESRKKSSAESELKIDGISTDSESSKVQAEVADISNEAPASESTSDLVTTPEHIKKSKKSKTAAKLDGTVTTEASTESRKALITEGSAQKGSPAEETFEPKREDGEKASAPSEEGESNEPADLQHNEESTVQGPIELMPPIEGTYVVPPAATKKDINLLQDLDENKLLELKEAFELFDYNQDGIIDYKDLKLTYQTLGYPDVPDDDITNMLAEAISPLDFDAFVILLGYKTIEMDPEAVLVEALACWDYDNSGLISEDRIKHDLMTWGDKFTSEEVEQALEDAPVYVNKKGATMIDYLKFSNTLCGLRKKTKPVDLG